MLLDVSVEPWPKVGLHHSFLGLELAVVSCEGRPVGLFEDFGSKIGRSVQHYSVGFSWPPQSSPEEAILHKAVCLVHFDKFVQFRVGVRDETTDEEVVQRSELGVLLLAPSQVLGGDGVDHISGEKVGRHLGAFLVDNLKVKLQHGFLKPVESFVVHRT